MLMTLTYKLLARSSALSARIAPLRQESASYVYIYARGGVALRREQRMNGGSGRSRSEITQKADGEVAA